MTREDERSLAARPELTPEKLMQGGVIVGVEQNVRGSLVAMSGMALERITRERAEVPPGYKLPERPVYFLDPNSRRMISISNREYTGGGERKTPDKYGLFAEVVELDEKGKPHYRLSTSDIILPNESYQLVAVGPNSDGLPPSYMEVEEAEEEEGEKKKKFVPWNMLLGQLQGWMNEASVDQNESPEAFIKRFSKLREGAEFKAKEKIDKTFRMTTEGHQGISERTVPMNLIITDEGKDSFLYQASVRAGLYPVLANPYYVADIPLLDPEFDMESWGKAMQDPKVAEVIGYLSLRQSPGERSIAHRVGVITIDDRALNTAQYVANSKREYEILNRVQSINILVQILQRDLPFFAVLNMRKPGTDSKKDKKEPDKAAHGLYYLSHNETAYEGLLRKLKADMILTMYVRGGAPIVK